MIRVSSPRVQICRVNRASSSPEMKKVIAPSREPLSSSDLEQESEKPVLTKPAPIRTEEEREHQQMALDRGCDPHPRCCTRDIVG
jgi:hypothetical protein